MITPDVPYIELEYPDLQATKEKPDLTITLASMTFSMLQRPNYKAKSKVNSHIYNVTPPEWLEHNTIERFKGKPHPSNKLKETVNIVAKLTSCRQRVLTVVEKRNVQNVFTIYLNYQKEKLRFR